MIVELMEVSYPLRNVPNVLLGRLHWMESKDGLQRLQNYVCTN